MNLNTLDEFHNAVQGDIESIPFGPECFAFVNEDGIALGLAHNARASHLWSVLSLRGDAALCHLYGPVVVVGRPDDEGEPTDVPKGFLGVE